MADVHPFRALRYDPALRLSDVVAPPFDTITPEHQRELYQRSPHNAVRIELALDEGGSRYENAAKTLREWIDKGVLRRDGLPGFYLLEQTFEHGGVKRTRRLLFARLRVVPWDDGAVLPHEQTFPKHKEDRLQLYRTAHINGSPVFLFYRDPRDRITEVLRNAAHSQIPLYDFTAADGQHHTLIRIDDPGAVEELERKFSNETLYIADGHHRYETALMYREEVRASRGNWTGDEPENFALVGLVAADDPGMLVLPTHRLIASELPWSDLQSRLEALFDVVPFNGNAGELEGVVAANNGPAFGIATKEAGRLFKVTVRDAAAVDKLLPQDRSPQWRALDYAIANRVLIQQIVGLDEDQMRDQSLLWFTEDAEHAAAQVRDGKAKYALLMKPAPVAKVLEIADLGEKMPQKSTYFYPKVPTGLVFNLLED
jgi:uncharacterized protein (DUF1015 family)